MTDDGAPEARVQAAEAATRHDRAFQAVWGRVGAAIAPGGRWAHPGGGSAVDSRKEIAAAFPSLNFRPITCPEVVMEILQEISVWPTILRGWGLKSQNP